MTKRQDGWRGEAATAIRKANRILLACHIRPDADALGSLLGMAHGLEQLGKTVQAVSPDGFPELYRFLPGWQRVTTGADGDFDLAIGMDADGSDRLGSAEPAILAAPVVIDLDHHTGPDKFGQIQGIETTAAATGEIVYNVLRDLEVRITSEIATCLLAAIITDTGSFRFTNVTPTTLRIAADLTEAGAHPSPIYEAVYANRSFAVTQLLGCLLESVQRTADGRIVWACLTQEHFRRAGVGTDATEGFVDQVRMVEGSQAALFLREEPNGEIRVSLRSRGNVNVARAAEEFGGGGHVPAAGCTLPGPIDEAARRVVEAVKRQLA